VFSYSERDHPVVVTPLAASAFVRIGGYSLEVGTDASSFAEFEPERETQNARELKAALTEEPKERPTVVVAVEEFEESAAAVTDRIQEADKLFRSAAAGELLEPNILAGEIDALLDLLGRLDKSGRFEEELALIRSLNGLLVLALRWYDLVRSLRTVLESAQVAGHPAGQAWAHHELGSLHLCADEPEKASQHLREALRIEEELGDLTGRCATRHNLDSARRDLALQGVGGRLPRLLRLAGLAAVLLALGGGATGLALALGGGSNDGKNTAEVSSATFTVNKDFVPDNPSGSVTVSVTCTTGTAGESPKTASEASPAVFVITGFTAGATCTATEANAPSGYAKNESDCRGVPLDSDSECTIVNTREKVSSATFTVNKDFVRDNPSGSVTVSVTCTTGTADESSKTASEAFPAVFTITGFAAGATCTATEGDAPDNYTNNESDCRGVPLDSDSECTIVNTDVPVP
jgi:hypothetical protein